MVTEKELPKNVEVSESQDHGIRKFAKIKDHIRTIASKILGKYMDHLVKNLLRSL